MTATTYQTMVILFDARTHEYEVIPFVRSQQRGGWTTGPFTTEAEAVTWAQQNHPQSEIKHAVRIDDRRGIAYMEREPGATTALRGGLSLYYRPR